MSAEDRNGRTIYTDTEACSKGAHDRCMKSWCTCNCHTQPSPQHRHQPNRKAGTVSNRSIGVHDACLRNVQAMYDDLDDLFPWTWGHWVSSLGDRLETGSITSPNGPRPDGSMHTYWSISGEVWQPHGELICEAVNAWVRPGWRGRLGRWLLGA